MNYANKWVTGIGTLPFITCSILLGSFSPSVHITVTALFAFFVSTIGYHKLVVSAPKVKQNIRFALFFSLPLIFTFGLMYI
jgi:hypothetical protein